MKAYLILILSLFTLSVSGQTLLPDPSTPTTKNINAVLGGSIAAAGTNTYTASLTGLSTYTGFAADFQFTNANTSTTCSINITGTSVLGAKSLKKYVSGSLVDIAVGDISAGARIRFYYNGTYLVMMSGVGGSSGGGWSVTGTTNLTGNTVIDGDVYSTKFSYDNDAYNPTSQLHKRYDSTRLDPEHFYNYLSFRDSTQHTWNEMFIGNVAATGGGTSEMYSQSTDNSGNRKIGQWYALPALIFNKASDETTGTEIILRIDATTGGTNFGNSNMGATGLNSYAFGNGSAGVNVGGSTSFGGGAGNSKPIIVNGANSFGWYETNSSQTTGHGVLAANSAVLGGLNPNIPSNATGSTILGGSGIKVSSGVTNTAHTQNIRIGSNQYIGSFSVTPTAKLHIAAGSATAGTAPLKMTSGTLLTTPENGVFGEFDGTHFYATVGSTRYQLDQQSGGGGSQTLQQVLTTGSTLTGDNTITNTSHTLSIDGTTALSTLKAGSVSAYSADTIYVFGDSYTQGVGATKNANIYVNQLGNLMGLPVKNLGASGTVLEKRSPNDPFGSTPNMIDHQGAIPTFGSKMAYLIIAYGFNDVLYNGANYTSANFSTDYTTILNTAITTRGWPASKVLLVTPFYPTQNIKNFYHASTGTAQVTKARESAFNSAALSLASSFSTKVFDAYAAVSHRQDSLLIFAADGIHPGDEYHQFLAQQIFNVLTNTSKANSQTIVSTGTTDLTTLKLSNATPVLNSGMLLGVDSLDRVGVISPFKFVRSNSSSVAGSSQINIKGKIIGGNLTNSVAINDVACIIAGDAQGINGGLKGGYGQFVSSLPSGMTGAGVEIGKIGSDGYIGSYDRTGGGALNLQINRLGGNVIIKGTDQGTGILQVNGDFAIHQAAGNYVTFSVNGNNRLTVTGDSVQFSSSKVNASYLAGTGSRPLVATASGNFATTTFSAISFTAQTAQAGGRNLTASDNGTTITTSNSSPITITIVAGLPLGFHCTIIQGSTGAVLVNPDTGVTGFGSGTTASAGDAVDVSHFGTSGENYKLKLY